MIRRREFMAGSAAAAVVRPGIIADQRAAAAWKIEVVMYDNPQGTNVGVSDATLLEDDTIFVPVNVGWRNTFTGYDWYSPDGRLRLLLVSRDRGLSWQVHEGHPPPERTMKLPDGKLARIRWLGYQQHQPSERPALERAGVWLYHVPEKNLYSSTGRFMFDVSSDGGKTWKSTELKLPHRAFLAGYGMATAKVLSNGTILMPAFGYLTRRHKTYACSVVRSADGGRTWDVITIAQDERPEAVSPGDIPSGAIWAKFPGILGFDEAQVVETRIPGRVVAVMEESWSKDLYASISNDYGKTWTKPRKTGMRGNTPLLLRLKSGALACAFTVRSINGGMMVCYSRDDGETWDIERRTVLRDHNARQDGQCLWNLVQFSDGTLFSSGWATKRGCGGGDEICYVVGFRFTEDFVTPLRVVNPRAKTTG